LRPCFSGFGWIRLQVFERHQKEIKADFRKKKESLIAGVRAALDSPICEPRIPGNARRSKYFAGFPSALRRRKDWAAVQTHSHPDKTAKAANAPSDSASQSFGAWETNGTDGYETREALVAQSKSRIEADLLTSCGRQGPLQNDYPLDKFTSFKHNF